MMAVSIIASEAPPACREVLIPRRNGAGPTPTGQGVRMLRNRRTEFQKPRERRVLRREEME